MTAAKHLNADEMQGSRPSPLALFPIVFFNGDPGFMETEERR